MSLFESPPTTNRRTSRSRRVSDQRAALCTAPCASFFGGGIIRAALALVTRSTRLQSSSENGRSFRWRTNEKPVTSPGTFVARRGQRVVETRGCHQVSEKRRAIPAPVVDERTTGRCKHSIGPGPCNQPCDHGTAAAVVQDRFDAGQKRPAAVLAVGLQGPLATQRERSIDDDDGGRGPDHSRETLDHVRARRRRAGSDFMPLVDQLNEVAHALGANVLHGPPFGCVLPSGRMNRRAYKGAWVGRQAISPVRNLLTDASYIAAEPPAGRDHDARIRLGLLTLVATAACSTTTSITPNGPADPFDAERSPRAPAASAAHPTRAPDGAAQTP